MLYIDSHVEFLEEPAFLADSLARTKGALTALQRRCEELGARLVMVPIPSESAIQADERERFQELAPREFYSRVAEVTPSPSSAGYLRSMGLFPA